MRYLFMLYADEKVGAAIPEREMAGHMERMYAYRDALEKAGALVETAPLAPTSQAVTVRVRDEKPMVLDGPYAETRDQLGGYFIVHAEDMDEAQAWALRCPAARWGSIEVRPILDLDR